MILFAIDLTYELYRKTMILFAIDLTSELYRKTIILFAKGFRFLYDFNNTHYALFVSQLKLVEKYDTPTQYPNQLVTILLIIYYVYPRLKIPIHTVSCKSIFCDSIKAYESYLFGRQSTFVVSNVIISNRFPLKFNYNIQHLNIE